MTVKDKSETPVLGSRALQNALDAVGAVGDSGFVIAPNEPSDEMLRSGAKAGGVSPTVARRIYKAMLGESG